MAWIESRRAKDGTVTWFVYWREAGRKSAKKSVKAGTRRRDAERLAVEIQSRVNAGLVGGGVIAKRATFGEFADKWLAMRIVRPTTLRRDRGLINTYLCPAFTSMLLNAITVEDVRALLAKVTKEQSSSTSRRLLAVLRRPIVRDGQWQLLDCVPAWEGNWTSDCFLAFAWHGSEREQFVVAVNYAPNQSQCYIRLPFAELGGRQWHLRDLLGEAHYERDGNDLQTSGLYLDLPAWGYHVFEMKDEG